MSVGVRGASFYITSFPLTNHPSQESLLSLTDEKEEENWQTIGLSDLSPTLEYLLLIHNFHG